MPSLYKIYLDQLRLDVTDAPWLAKLGEYRGRQELFARQTPEILKALREHSVIESVESSNRIEGVTAPLPRIEAMVQKNSEPRDRPEQEIAGYRDALALIHESGKEMPFSTNVIRQIHTMLYRHSTGRGGEWKGARNDIIERNALGTSRVRFSPPEPMMVPSMMESLTGDYQRETNAGQEALILIPLAVLDFLCIHPFLDGNGRTGRLLTLMLLYQNGYEVGRYVSLERIIEESKETYYEALERSSKDWYGGSHDPMPWVRYFWGVLIAAYKEFEERIGAEKARAPNKSGLVEDAVNRQVKPFTISEIEADSPGVSRDWIRIVLRKMRDDGRIIPIGKGRGARWLRRDT